MIAAWLRRRDRVDVAFVLLAVVAAATLLRLGLGLTFFADEWAFIQSPSLGDPGSWFQPHNEHWSTLPIIAYRLLVETVGLQSYVPYLALVTTLHLIVAALVYKLARAKAGAAVGLGAAIIVLFLGSGFENLYWGFQIGFVGSTATGLAAMALLDGTPSRTRVAGAIGFLVAGLMCSGMGITFLVVVAVELLLDPTRRRLLPLLAIPAGTYAAWYVAIGRSGIAAVRPFTPGAILDAPAAIVGGLGNAVGGAVGIGPDFGAWLGLIGAGLVFAAAVTGRLGANLGRVCGCLAGIVAQYALIGIFRTADDVDVTNYSRYTYITATLVIVGASAVVGAIWSSPAPARSSREARNRRRFALLAGGGLLALALTWNVRLLVEGRELFVTAAAITRAFETVGLERPLPPGVDPERPIGLVPAPAALERIVARYGSPLGDSIAPGFVAPILPDLRAAALRRLVQGAPDPPP